MKECEFLIYHVRVRKGRVLPFHLIVENTDRLKALLVDAGLIDKII